MPRSRRDFVRDGALGAMAAVLSGPASPARAQAPNPTPGAPPAFGTAPPVGPVVNASTFAQAEELVQVEMKDADREEAAQNWRMAMAPLLERRTGPKRVWLGERDPPAMLWNPMLEERRTLRPAAHRIVRTPVSTTAPASDEMIAFAPVVQLSRWLERRQLTSERLTRICLERLHRYNAELRCAITILDDHALTQARAADREIASGRYRGPLHGIPWGAKDLLDTAGIPTTFGAEPFRHRIPSEDATVVRRLAAAGAVLAAKLSLGALALNDIWFGGQTRNPWLPEEGSSGSSAGPGAAVAAGLVAFAIGSETGGSIVSPSMRCGVTGLRPTFGRVPRTGAMTLCWSLDKLGPMARCVEDTVLVLDAISGPDPGDVASVPASLDFDATRTARGIRAGYFPDWMRSAPATDVDRAALDALQRLGAEVVPVHLPDWPYDSLNLILFAEAAAAFEEITLDGRVAELRAQVPDAWPNTFRQARFLSAVDMVQADRLRRKVAIEMERIFRDVDVLLVPSLRDEMLVISNFTGHPSLTLRAGFVHVSEARSDWAPDPDHPPARFAPPRRVPHGVTLIGRLFREGQMCELGLAMERHFSVWAERPERFG